MSEVIHHQFLISDYRVVISMMKYQLSELYPYYRICRYLGIFCIQYNPKQDRYRVSRSLICYLVHFALQAYLISCMIILVWFWTVCFRTELTATGNHYERFVLFSALVIQFVQNAWLIWLQGSHVRIVRQLELYRSKYLSSTRLLFPQRLLWIIGIMNILYLINFVKNCLMAWLINASGWFTFSTLGFPLRAIISSFILGTYVCLIHIVRHLLASNQQQLEILVQQLKHPKRICSDILRLRNCLDLHDRLLVLCSDQISLVYGFNIWLCLLFCSLDASSILYIVLVSGADSTPIQHLVLSIVWLCPTFMTSTTALMSDLAGEQVCRSLNSYDF